MPRTSVHIKIIALLVSLTVLANNFFITLGLGNIYYVVLIAAFAVLVLSRKRPIVNLKMVFFIIACICSILVNDIPYFYKPYERLIAFIIIVGLIGPLVQNPSLKAFKNLLFKYLNTLIVIMVLLSFIGLMLNSSLVYLGRGGFTGLFNHSMFLSPMAAISMITCVYYGTMESNKKKRLAFYIIAISSFIACLTAGSRAALIAGVLGVLYFFYKANQENLKQYYKVLFITFFIGLLSFPLWESYTEKLTEKMEYAEQKGGFFTTRESLWERRLDEFISSPIYGIGFANDSSKTESDLIVGGGQIEPGSSWLVILSMTGLFGTIVFFNMFFGVLRKLNKKTNNSFNNYLKALLVFFIIHLVAEGYGLSAGSGLFFYFWLLLGIMAQKTNLKTTSNLSVQ
ncbi:O-antigen ligase family protein [Bizionia gelidisalsuginis]|uniref:O-antigen ligase family protein n=1 Tax=Bizionia gelidisalsuginis TaxID=291188 RepID=A0ABY3M7B5_9FLAO|nr:O-antigen ligase family protein [Bizionia gelidisalsuginis]TYC08803.1 O-antigen ligase family protein [Bizionia gelidisalsuginis]